MLLDLIISDSKPEVEMKAWKCKYMIFCRGAEILNASGDCESFNVVKKSVPSRREKSA